MMMTRGGGDMEVLIDRDLEPELAEIMEAMTIGCKFQGNIGFLW
uniref:Uncharacterized protein n=1 Tax=Nelumbo nucifera TaxID=4432 RepID=A0A822ZU81_NELNU|nr:TPA_asm: hypothetical protein HUJ06_018460 [Nelumbo nucifera]